MGIGKTNRLRRLGLLAAAFCLSLVLLSSLGALPALAANSGSASGPDVVSASGSLPPGITPVVVLQGSDYNMGYQYAQQVIAYFGTWFFQRTPGVYEPFTDAQILALKA